MLFLAGGAHASPGMLLKRITVLPTLGVLASARALFVTFLPCRIVVKGISLRPKICFL